jgi:predicted DNA-binding transcriptional regulator YafY
MKRVHQALTRLYWIDAVLRRGDPTNATRMARQLGVSTGTILRDLARLREEYRAPITYDPAVRGFSYRMNFRPDLPRLDVIEAMDLAELLVPGGSIKDSALERSLTTLGERLALLLPQLDPRARPGQSTPRPLESAPTFSVNAVHKTARRRGRGVRTEREPGVEVVLRFDASAGPQVLLAGLLKREDVQFLTDGGLETTIATEDPEALLLDLLRWAPHFEIKRPIWLRHRLPIVLRRILKQIDSGGKKRKRAKSRARA